MKNSFADSGVGISDTYKSFRGSPWGPTTPEEDFFKPGTSHRNRNVAPTAPASCAKINRETSAGLIPANVLLNDLAMVTAGLAKDVDAVNQYAAVM